MSDVLIDQDTMEDIGDSIRSKLGVQTTYLPSEMPNAIMSISGGGNEMELTKAEYDALTEAEKTNGTTYYITDAQSWTSKEVQPVIYSTDEREIGVWIDGKPLYQKTVNMGSLVNGTSWTAVQHNISNIETVIKTFGHINKYTNNAFIVGYVANIYRPTQTTGVVIEVQPTTIDYINNWLEAGSSFYVTLQYTKTTDQPGSGIYTPQGQLAVHYSTEEHVIGTWIDGKTLYEKTVQGNIPSKTGYMNLFYLASGVTIQRIDGYVRRTGDINIPSGTLGFYMYSEVNGVNCYNSEQGNYGQPFTIIVQYTKTTD